MFSMSMMMASAGAGMDYTKFLLRPSSCVSDETGVAVALDKAIYFNGSSSLYFTGDSGIVLGTGDFTVEFWFLVTSTASQKTFLDARPSLAATPWTVNVFSSNFSFYNGGAHHTTSGIIPTINTWNHLAVVRSSSVTKIYVNGTSYCTFADSTNYTNGANTCYIGRGWDSGFEVIGYMSNIRIAKGIARYTGTFTPSTTITQDSYDKLIVSPTNSTISDAATAKTITKVGNPTVNLAKSAHPVATYGDVNIKSLTSYNWSVYFDGSGDYITSPDSVDFDFGTGDFTIDCWVNPATAINQGVDDLRQILCAGSQLVNGNNAWSMAYGHHSGWGTGTRMAFAFTTDTNWTWAQVSDPFTITYPCHIAAVRSSGTMTYYINGQILNRYTCTTNIDMSGGSPLYIGVQYISLGLSWYHVGTMANLRISKGIGRWTQNFNPDTIDYTVDPYTRFLLAPTNARISDKAGRSITVYGDAVVVDDTIGKAISMDGNGDYSSVPDTEDWNFGANDFTIESYVKFKDTNQVVIVSQYNSNTNAIAFTLYWQAGTLIATISKDGTGVTASITKVQYTWTPTLNQWYHIAFTRTGGYTYLWVDGSQVGSTQITMSPNTIYNSSEPLRVGSQVASNGSYVYANANFTKVRVSKGIARYTATFTPSNINYAVDSYTKLYVDPVSSYIVDRSECRTVTTNGDTKVIATPSLERVLAFDGSGDYLSIPDSEDWTFGSGNFTLEGWYNFSIITGNEKPLFFQITTGAPSISWALQYYPTGGGFWIGLSTNGVSWAAATVIPWTPVVGTWYHIAMVRYGNVVRVFVNGAQVGSDIAFSGTLFNSTVPLLIGRNSNDAASREFGGFMSNLRISKGVARYTANFNPATSFTVDGNTVLYLKDDFVDVATGKTVTKVGDSKTVYNLPLSDKCVTFDGTDDYITVPASSEFDFGTAAFTVEMWAKATSSSGSDYPLIASPNYYAAGYNNGWCLYYKSSGQGGGMALYVSDGTYVDLTFSTGVLPINIWYHIALVRSGNTLNLYKDGVLANTCTYAGSFSDSANGLSIGGISRHTQYFYGQISNIRISKGKALYTANFTPSLIP